MNLTQMQSRLRLELMRRIQRGSLSLSLLSRKTGLGSSHLSNFLHHKRGLSFAAVDRILMALPMAATDLLPSPGRLLPNEPIGLVPVVSHETAMHELIVRRSTVVRLLHLPEELLDDRRARCRPARKAWLRFVAIRAGAADVAAMSPLILPDALIVLDRHYTALAQYRPDRPNLYAIRHDAHLTVRYVDFQASRLVLRPHNRDASVELVELIGEEAPGDHIAGRVIAIFNQF